MAEGAAERPRAATGVEILPAASGEDSYGLSVCFPEMASVGSSHNRSTWTTKRLYFWAARL